MRPTTVKRIGIGVGASMVALAAVAGVLGVWNESSPARPGAVQARLEALNSRAIAAVRTILGDPGFVGAPARFAEPREFVAALLQDEEMVRTWLRPIAQDLVKRDWDRSERSLEMARSSMWGKVPVRSGAREVLINMEFADALESIPAESERVSRFTREELEGLLVILLAHEQVHVYQHHKWRAFDRTPSNRSREQRLANIAITEGHAEYVARQVAIQLGLTRHWELWRDALRVGPVVYFSLGDAHKHDPPSIYAVGADHFERMVQTFGASGAESRAYRLPRPNCGLLMLPDKKRLGALVAHATRDALAVENCALRVARGLRLLGERAWMAATFPRSMVGPSGSGGRASQWSGELVAYVVQTRTEAAAPFEQTEITFSCFDSHENAQRFAEQDALFARLAGHIRTREEQRFELAALGHRADCVSFEGLDSDHRTNPIGLAVFRLGPMVVSIRVVDPAAPVRERLQECLELALMELRGTGEEHGAEGTRSVWIESWHALSTDSVLGKRASGASLAHPDHLVRLATAIRQAALAKSATAVPAQLTDHEHWRLRWIALERRIEFAANDPEERAALYRKAFQDRSAALVVTAFEHALNSDEGTSWPELRKAMLQQDGSMQVRILRLLDDEHGKWDQPGQKDVAKELCEVLQRIFDHGDDVARVAALRALLVFYDLPPAAPRLVIRGIQDRNRPTREMALTVLGYRVSPVKGTLHPMLELLDDPAGTDVGLIARALSSHGSDAAPALGRLRAALASAKGEDADEIKAAIERIEGER